MWHEGIHQSGDPNYPQALPTSQSWGYEGEEGQHEVEEPSQVPLGYDVEVRTCASSTYAS